MRDSAEVEIGAMALLDQASMTAQSYMLQGVRDIDAVFGKGYAKEHPELLAAFMQTAALDFHAGLLKVGLQDLRDVLRELPFELDKTVERGFHTVQDLMA